MPLVDVRGCGVRGCGGRFDGAPRADRRTVERTVAPRTLAPPHPLSHRRTLAPPHLPEADGRWIAYQSTEAGQTDVYVEAFPGPGQKFRISTSGGGAPRWRADGRELLYMTPMGI